MNETASLLIKVDSEPVGKASDRLQSFIKIVNNVDARQVNFNQSIKNVTQSFVMQSSAVSNLTNIYNSYGRSTENATRATDGLIGFVKRLAVAYLGLHAIIEGVKKLIGQNREFGIMQGQLVSATDSVENAEVAMKALKKFAYDTPYDLKQTTDAFVQLVNVGLTPSERALRSYGNTAAAFHKELVNVANAVARAVAHEFEPLKTNFNVGAKLVKDGIEFTFRGIKTVVKDNATDIENYMMGIGEKFFPKAMDARMETLDGRLAQLSETWNNFFVVLGKAGANTWITQFVVGLTTAVQYLSDAFSSGEIQGYVMAFFKIFEPYTKDLIDLFKIAGESIAKVFAWLGMDTEKTVSGIAGQFIDLFITVPAYARAAVKMIGATWGVLLTYAEIIGQGFSDIMADKFKAVPGQVNSVMAAIKRVIAGQDIGDSMKELFFANVSSGPSAASLAWEDTKKRLESATDAYKEFAVGVAGEATKAKQAFVDRLVAASKLTAEMKKNLEIQNALNKFFDPDVLEKFSKKPPPGLKNISEHQKNQLDALKQRLLDEEDALEEHYQKQKKIIIDGTQDGSKEQLALFVLLDQENNMEWLKASDKKAKRYEDEYNFELEMLKSLLYSKQISEEEFQTMSAAKWTEYMGKVKGITLGGTQQVMVMQMQMQADALGMASHIADGLSGLAQENNATAKALFLTAKAVAIAEAIVQTHLGATKALGQMGAFGIPMSSLILASGYANVAIMAAQGISEYQGKFAKGGMISAGRYGVTQEEGFEITQGPANVMSAAATRDFMGSPRGGKGVVVNIHNNAGVQVDTQERDTTDGKVIDVMLSKTERQLAAGVRNGGGPLSRQLESTYGLRRGATA